MKNDEINRTIQECFKCLDYRDNEIAKLNFNNLSLVDKNIEILEYINCSMCESSLKLSFISKEIPEHSCKKKYIYKLITILNDGRNGIKGVIDVLRKIKNDRKEEGEA